MFAEIVLAIWKKEKKKKRSTAQIHSRFGSIYFASYQNNLKLYINVFAVKAPPLGDTL